MYKNIKISFEKIRVLLKNTMYDIIGISKKLLSKRNRIQRKDACTYADNRIN